MKLDEYNRSALHYICIDIPIEERLNKTNELINSGYNINAQDKYGWTPLHFAAQAGSKEIIHFLISSKANVNIKESNGNTPLWIAAMNSNNEETSDIIKILINAGANPEEKNFHDVSPIDFAPELFK